MKLSARNQFTGKIISVEKHQNAADVRVDLGGGIIITASVANEAVDHLSLKVCDQAVVVIKASDIILAK